MPCRNDSNSRGLLIVTVFSLVSSIYLQRRINLKSNGTLHNCYRPTLKRLKCHFSKTPLNVYSSNGHLSRPWTFSHFLKGVLFPASRGLSGREINESRGERPLPASDAFSVAQVLAFP